MLEGFSGQQYLGVAKIKFIHEKRRPQQREPPFCLECTLWATFILSDEHLLAVYDVEASLDFLHETSAEVIDD
jgi:hypothetical protein